MVPFKGKEKTEYVKINLPKPMAEEITRIINSDSRLGFVSIQEFVKEGVRRSIVEYGGIVFNKSEER